MDIVALLPFIVLIGAMFLMTRSAKNKQRAAAQMRDQMQPGTGVRTIGGLYATVKEVGHDVVVVEMAPGVHATFAKNAIGAVLEEEEYRRIVNGEPEAPTLADDGVSAVPDSPAGLDPVDLGKDDRTGAGPDAAAPADREPEAEDAPVNDAEDRAPKGKDDEGGPAAR